MSHLTKVVYYSSRDTNEQKKTNCCNQNQKKIIKILNKVVRDFMFFFYDKLRISTNENIYKLKKRDAHKSELFSK